MRRLWALTLALFVLPPFPAFARMSPEEQQLALLVAAALLKKRVYIPLIYTKRYGVEYSVAMRLTEGKEKEKPQMHVAAGIGRNVYYVGVVREDPKAGIWATAGVATEQNRPRSAIFYIGIIGRISPW